MKVCAHINAWALARTFSWDRINRSQINGRLLYWMAVNTLNTEIGAKENIKWQCFRSNIPTSLVSSKKLLAHIC